MPRYEGAFIFHIIFLALLCFLSKPCLILIFAFLLMAIPILALCYEGYELSPNVSLDYKTDIRLPCKSYDICEHQVVLLLKSLKGLYLIQFNDNIENRLPPVSNSRQNLFITHGKGIHYIWQKCQNVYIYIYILFKNSVLYKIFDRFHYTRKTNSFYVL